VRGWTWLDGSEETMSGWDHILLSEVSWIFARGQDIFIPLYASEEQQDC